MTCEVEDQVRDRGEVSLNKFPEITAESKGVERTREDADSYERTGNVDGRMQTEEWNKTSNRGKFGTIFNDRFWVEAEGHADSIDQLKSAVAAVAAGDLQSLAN